MARTSLAGVRGPCEPATLRPPGWGRRPLHPVLVSPAPPPQQQVAPRQPQAARRGQPDPIVPPVLPPVFPTAPLDPIEPVPVRSNRKSSPAAHVPLPARTTAPDTPLLANISSTAPFPYEALRCVRRLYQVM